MATDYRCPPRTAPADERLAWLKNTRSQSIAWLQTQPTYRSFQEAIALISGMNDDEVLPEGLSNIRAGEVRRDIRELVETLANLRATSSFKTDNKAQYTQAGLLNQLYNAYWFMCRPNEQVKGALQMAAGMGRGFLSVEWDPDFHSVGRGNVAMKVYGPHEVLPVQLPKDGEYQRAYAVHVVNEMPIAMAHRKFWESAKFITADRNSPTWMKKGMDKIQQFLSPVLNLFGVGTDGPNTDPIFPTTDIVYTYVDDPAVNQTGHDVQMGTPGTSWAYSVPSMGTQIWSGLNDPATGQKLMRDVTYDDARLYPNRRLLIWCDAHLIYDDASYWWHGKVPTVPFDLDRWVWEAIGRPLTADVVSIERSMTRLLRSIDDSANTRLSPPLTVSEEAISEDLAEDFNPRIPNQTLRLTSLQSDPIKPLLPADFYNVPAYIPEFVKYLESRIQRILGVTDATAIMKARQMPAGDSIEKMREMAGSIVVGMTNNMEMSLQLVGEMWVSLVFQYMTVQRRMQILGDDGVTPEDFDFDPGSLVPSHLPGESTDGASRFSTLDRAKWAATQFYFFVVPGSLHRITQMTRKLLLIQLKKAGVPIDRWTMADAFEVENYGAKPVGTHTVMERVVAEQRMAEEAQVRMAKAMQEAGVQPGGGGSPGRPASGNKAPHPVQKDGGTRTAISQS